MFVSKIKFFHQPKETLTQEEVNSIIPSPVFSGRSIKSIPQIHTKKWIDNVPTKEIIQHDPLKAKRRKYWKRVWELTENVAHLLPGIEKRSFKHYHIDHKISIWQGFKSSIPPEFIGDISNLRVIPAALNLKKGIKSDL